MTRSARIACGRHPNRPSPGGRRGRVPQALLIGDVNNHWYATFLTGNYIISTGGLRIFQITGIGFWAMDK